MDQRLLHLILDHVEAVVKNQPPSRPESLWALLAIAKPELTLDDIYNKTKRDHAFKSLQSLIHPDKCAATFGNDPKEMIQVTHLFQDTSDFYLLCVDHLKASNNQHVVDYSKAVLPAAGAPQQPYAYYATEEELAIYQPNRDRDRARASPAQQHYRTSRRDMRSHSPSSGTRKEVALVETTHYQQTPQKKRSPRYANEPTYTPRERQRRSRNSSGHSHSPVRHSSSHSPVRHHNVIQKRPSKDPYFGVLDSYAMNGRLPVSMDALKVWPFIAAMSTGGSTDEVSPTQKVTQRKLAWIMACRCMNARGAILHGQRLRKDYFQVTNSSKLLNNFQTVDSVLQHFGTIGQSHMFRTVRDIQHEIIQHGPVISISFRPDEHFHKAHRNAFQPFPKSVSQFHPVLIVGWTVTKTGELWKIQSLYDKNAVVHVGFGQWDIDKAIMAPGVARLEQIPWQSPGPFLDLKMPKVSDTTRDWRESATLGISLTTHELETLSHILSRSTAGGGGFEAAIANHSPFVIRDKFRLGYSRRYVLREVTNDPRQNKWKVSVARYDASFEKTSAATVSAGEEDGLVVRRQANTGRGAGPVEV